MNNQKQKPTEPWWRLFRGALAAGLFILLVSLLISWVLELAGAAG